MASRSNARSNPFLVGLRLVFLGAWLALCVPPHLIIRALTGRSPVARLFLVGVAWILGLRIRRKGARPPVRSLLLANHPSWLDIVVLSASIDCAFVSKAEVQKHALVGWLADQRDTLYVNRDRRRELKRQIEAIQERFDHHLPLALFPEGTTSDGTRLRPFRPALLTAVTPPPPDSHVIPVAIDYGEDAAFVSWTAGEGGVENALRILSRRRTITVAVRLLDPLDSALDRKAMALAAHEAIVGALETSKKDAVAL